MKCDTAFDKSFLLFKGPQGYINLYDRCFWVICLAAYVPASPVSYDRIDLQANDVMAMGTGKIGVAVQLVLPFDLTLHDCKTARNFPVLDDPSMGRDNLAVNRTGDLPAINLFEVPLLSDHVFF